MNLDFGNRTQVLLLVEGEILIADVLEDILDEAGYAVRRAACAAQAIEVIEDQVRLSGLIVDVGSAIGRADWEIARYARSRHPQVAVLYITAGGAGEWMAERVQDSRLLQKPFRPSVAVREISALIALAEAEPGWS